MGTPYSQVYGKQKTPPLPKEFSIEVTRTVASFPRRVYIQWALRKPPAGEGFLFDVYRAGSSEGPWEELATDLANTYFFVDEKFDEPVVAGGERRDLNLFSLHRAIYYKVVCRFNTQTAETVAHLEAGLDRRRKGIRRKLIRDAAKALKLVVGVEMAVLKRRRWGVKCDRCVSKGTTQTVRAHCKYCWGTGFLEGYWAPVYGYAQRRRTPIQTQVAPEGNVDTHRLEVVMLNVPQVEPGDVLVFLRDDKRYMIELVNPTQLHAVDVHQELQVSELARSAREYGPLVDPWRDPMWF
jgi:hypothetical protein